MVGLAENGPLLVGLLHMCFLVEGRLLPESMEAHRDEVLLNAGAQAALSMAMGYGGVPPLRYALTVSVDTLAAMSQHLSSLSSRTHRMILSQPLVTENLFRREHHVGASVFEAALTANYATKVAEIPLITQRVPQGLFAGALYWSAKSRPMGLTFVQSALVHRATGYTRHLPLVYIREPSGTGPATGIRVGRNRPHHRDGEASKRGVRQLHRTSASDW